MENVYDFLNVKDRTAVYFHDYLYFNGDESSMVDDGPGEANMGAYTLYSFSILNVYESLINFMARVCDPEKLPPFLRKHIRFKVRGFFH